MKVWAAEGGNEEAEATSPPVVPASAGETPNPEPEQEAPAAAQTPALPTPAPAPKPVDWRERRLGAVAAARDAARARVEELEAKLAAVKPPAPAAVAEAVINERAEALARERAAELAFLERCNATAAAGRSAFGEAEFNSRVTALTQVVDKADQSQVAAYNLLLDAAIETGKGPQIIHQLGGNLDEAARLMTLPPVKLGMELAKLANAAVRDVTAAPKPLTPIGQRGASNERIDPRDPERADKLSTAEWMARREAQEKERYAGSR
jgi:hypothetical protein